MNRIVCALFIHLNMRLGSTRLNAGFPFSCDVLLKRASFTSIQDLQQRILDFIDFFNKTMAKHLNGLTQADPLIYKAEHFCHDALGAFHLLDLKPGADPIQDRLFGYNDLFQVGVGGDIVHQVDHDIFQDGPEPPGARAFFCGQVHDPPERLRFKGQVNAVHFKEFPVLFGDGIFRLGEDA